MNRTKTKKYAILSILKENGNLSIASLTQRARNKTSQTTASVQAYISLLRSNGFVTGTSQAIELTDKGYDYLEKAKQEADDNGDTAEEEIVAGESLSLEGTAGHIVEGEDSPAPQDACTACDFVGDLMKHKCSDKGAGLKLHGEPQTDQNEYQVQASHASVGAMNENKDDTLPEVVALAEISRILEAMDEHQRRRILNWAHDRYSTINPRIKSHQGG